MGRWLLGCLLMAAVTAKAGEQTLPPVEVPPLPGRTAPVPGRMTDEAAKAAAALAKEIKDLAGELARLENGRLVRRFGAKRFPLMRDDHPAVAAGRLALEKISADWPLIRYYGLDPLRGHLAVLRGALTALREDRDPMLHLSAADREAGRRRTGSLEGAYVSPIDGSVQPFLYYVPRALAEDKAAAAPLVIVLHGYVPDYTKRSWVTPDPTLERLMEGFGAVLLWPFGRGNTDFLSIGEVDVLSAIEEIRRRYPVDDRRIYLTGYSMGGSGVWTLAAHYPDRWAAAKAWSGRNDWFHWHEARLAAAASGRDLFPAYKRPLVLADNPYDLAPTLRELPFWAVHPLDDTMVQPTQSSRIHSLLTPPDGRMTLSQPERGGHFHIFDEWRAPAAWQPLFGQVRAVDPDTVEHVTYTPKYGAKHWLAIQALADPTRPARLRVRRDGNGYVVERHENVARFAILPGRDPWRDTPAPTPAVGPVTLAPGVPGQLAEHRAHVQVGAAAGDRAAFEIAEKAPSPETAAAPSAAGWPTKTANGEQRTYGLTGGFGPLKETFNAPFALVLGSRDDGEPDPATMAGAQRFFKDWFLFAHAEAPVLLDRDLIAGLDAAKDDPKALATWKRNYVLLGSPRTNRYLARIADRLPFRFHADGYGLVGADGEERTAAHSGKPLGLAALYPNPEFAERPPYYIAVLDGLYYGEKQSFNHKWDLAPDFLVFDEDLDPTDGNNRARLAALFNRQWQAQAPWIWSNP